MVNCPPLLKLSIDRLAVAYDLAPRQQKLMIKLIIAHRLENIGARATIMGATISGFLSGILGGGLGFFLAKCFS